MIKKLAGEDVVMGTPSLGIIGGDNGSEPEGSPKVFENVFKMPTVVYRYFVSYVWESDVEDSSPFNLYDSTIVSSNHPISSEQDLKEIQNLLMSHTSTRPTILFFKELP